MKTLKSAIETNSAPVWFSAFLFWLKHFGLSIYALLALISAVIMAIITIPFLVWTRKTREIREKIVGALLSPLFNSNIEHWM